jgi:hypothetical protein
MTTAQTCKGLGGFFVEGQTASPLLFPELAIDLAQVFALGPGQPSVS